MAVKRPQKLRKFQGTVTSNSKCVKTKPPKVRRKSGVKNAALKSGLRNVIQVPPKQISKDSKKKFICLKTKYRKSKSAKQNKLLRPLDSEERIALWLNEHTAKKSPHQQEMQALSTTSSANSSTSNIESASLHNSEISTIFRNTPSKKPSLSMTQEKVTNEECKEDYKDDMSVSVGQSTTEERSEIASLSSQCHPSQSIDIAGVHQKVSDEPVSCLDTKVLDGVEETPDYTEEQRQEINSSLERGRFKSDLNPRIWRRPLTQAKCIKLNGMARRKLFHRFYLKNSQGGYHLALKKFHNSKQFHSLKGKVGKLQSPPTQVPSERNLSAGNVKDVPLKISVKKKLRSACISQLSSPEKDLNRSLLQLSPKNTFLNNVVSCEVPFEDFVDSGVSEDGRSTPDERLEPRIMEKDQPSTKRDVCYIFAVLDRDKDETMFKCSPHFKSSNILKQLYSVFESISADDDLMISQKNSGTPSKEFDIPPTFHSPHDSPGMTNPASFTEDHTKCEEKMKDSNPVHDSQTLSTECSTREDNGESEATCKDQKIPFVNSMTKVMVSKSLLSLTSALKFFSDICIRLLDWCSQTIQGDIDSDLLEDKFEGFLCYCHDQVSILIECLFILDSNQIINMDDKELKRIWLLHDALCCMLQAYRYTLAPPLSSVNEHLISLLITCAKMILPSSKVSIGKWISLMTMIQNIGKNFQDDKFLKACQCNQLFASLASRRFCRVCDVECFYDKLKEDSSPPVPNSVFEGKPRTCTSTSAAVEQLFPRLSWFLNSIDGWSKDDFQSAFMKHSLLKFSCNMHSGLYPCDKHLSEITCSCFIRSDSDLCLASRVISSSECSSYEPQNDQEKRVSVGVDQQGSVNDACKETSNDCGSNIDQQYMESSHSPASSPAPNQTAPSSSISINDDLEEFYSSTSTIQVEDSAEKGTELNVASKPVQESLFSSETVNLSLDESIVSSENFTLRYEELPHVSDLYKDNFPKLQGAKVIQKDPKDPSSPSTTSEHKDPDTPSTSDSAIDYSPLNFRQAQSSIASAYSPIKNHPSQQKNDTKLSSGNLALTGDKKERDCCSECTEVQFSENRIEEQESDLSSLLRDTSIGDDSVFGSSPSQDPIMKCSSSDMLSRCVSDTGVTPQDSEDNTSSSSVQLCLSSSPSSSIDQKLSREGSMLESQDSSNLSSLPPRCSMSQPSVEKLDSSDDRPSSKQTKGKNLKNQFTPSSSTDASTMKSSSASAHPIKSTDSRSEYLAVFEEVKKKAQNAYASVQHLDSGENISGSQATVKQDQPSHNGKEKKTLTDMNTKKWVKKVKFNDCLEFSDGTVQCDLGSIMKISDSKGHQSQNDDIGVHASCHKGQSSNSKKVKFAFDDTEEQMQDHEAFKSQAAINSLKKISTDSLAEKVDNETERPSMKSTSLRSRSRDKKIAETTEEMKESKKTGTKRKNFASNVQEVLSEASPADGFNKTKKAKRNIIPQQKTSQLDDEQIKVTSDISTNWKGPGSNIDNDSVSKAHVKKNRDKVKSVREIVNLSDEQAGSGADETMRLTRGFKSRNPDVGLGQFSNIPSEEGQKKMSKKNITEKLPVSKNQQENKDLEDSAKPKIKKSRKKNIQDEGDKGTDKRNEQLDNEDLVKKTKPSKSKKPKKSKMRSVEDSEVNNEEENDATILEASDPDWKNFLIKLEKRMKKSSNE